jgi:hypothetical protein
MSTSDHSVPAVMPHRGTLILILGILGMVTPCLIFAIVSWVMGKMDLDRMKAGEMDADGEPMTKVGMILGIIACCLQIVGLIMAILLFGFAAGGAMVAN